MHGLLRRRVGALPLAVGGLVWLAALGCVLAAVAPGGSYLAAWPALAGALTGVLAALTSSRVVRVLTALIGGAVAVVVLVPTVVLFFPALGLSTAAAPAAVATVLALALLPALEGLFPAGPARLRSLAVPGVAAGLAVLLTAVGLAVDRFDQQHPVPSRLAYALEADTGDAWWFSTEDEPGEEAARYVGTPRTLPHDYPYVAGSPVAAGPAEDAGLPPPTVEVLEDRTAGASRTVTVRVTPQRAVGFVVLDLDAGGGRVVAARAEARDVPAAALGEDRLWLTFHAPPEQGLEATVTVDGAGPLRLRVVDGSTGLAGLPGFEPRLPGVDTAGSHTADLVVVGATTDLG